MSVSTKTRKSDQARSSNQGKALKAVTSEESSDITGHAKQLRDGAIQDIVDEISEDILGLKVQYNDLHIQMGAENTPNDTKYEPIVDWTPNENKYYTLLMTDPDAPSREDPKFREWQHWLVVNIPGNKVKEGSTLTEYIGPKPPKDTGLHRYFFLLFEHPEGKIQFHEEHKNTVSVGNRKSFKTRAFMKKYKLQKPVAATYFQAKYDRSY